MIITLNICDYEQFDRSKIELLVWLAKIIEVQKYSSLLNTLINYGLIDNFKEPGMYANNDTTNEKQLNKAILVDDIEKLKIILASPIFDNKQTLNLKFYFSIAL